MTSSTPWPISPAPSSSADNEVTADGIDSEWLLSMIGRRWKLFVVVSLLIFAMTMIYTFGSKPVYTATSSLMIDAQHLQLFGADHNQAVTPGVNPDSNAVDTQVEVMRSREIAEVVFKSLNLDHDPDFMPKAQGHGLGAAMSSFLRNVQRQPDVDEAPTPILTQARHEKAIDTLLKNLDIHRIGATYVIEIDYTLADRIMAAAISNKFADCYLADAIKTKLSATRQASGLLSGRLDALGDNAARDAAAVQQYKIAHGLLSASGATLTEQEISGYNQQLATAKAQAAEDEARLRTAQAQLAHGSVGDDVGEALNSPVIQSLRSQRAVASGQLAQLSARYGPRYPDILKVQGQLADLDIQIHSEIERIISNLQANAEVSRQRVASMNKTLAGAQGTLAVNGRAQVELTLLEGKATASQTLYDSYLNRFKETSTQEGTEQSGARIVSRAEIPTEPSAPKVGLYLGFGAVLAIGIGSAAMLLAEALERNLLNGEDFERRLGRPYLGGIINLKSISPRDAGSPPAYLISSPTSPFAESVRNLRAALWRPEHEPGQALGITSALNGEGKTTTAMCLGQSAALQGRTVVVIDCDLRHRGLSRRMLKNPRDGLLNLLAGSITLEDALVKDTASGASFLPMGQMPAPVEDIFSGRPFAGLLVELKQRFDVVILDMPAVLEVSDARILASKCAAVLLLAQWRKTPRLAAKEALRILELIGARIVGVALTRTTRSRA